MTGASHHGRALVPVHLKEVCFPLIHPYLLHHCYSSRGLLFKGLFVGQLGHMILGGKVESHSFTVCVSLEHILYTFLLLYYIS